MLHRLENNHRLYLEEHIKLWKRWSAERTVLIAVAWVNSCVFRGYLGLNFRLNEATWGNDVTKLSGFVPCVAICNLALIIAASFLRTAVCDLLNTPNSSTYCVNPRHLQGSPHHNRRENPSYKFSLVYICIIFCINLIKSAFTIKTGGVTETASPRVW